MSLPPGSSDRGGSRHRRDYDRTLGVVECFSVVTRQCPNGAARRVAERALESAKQDGAGGLREQAFYVLTAIRGWRGERAAQVHRSLKAFVDGTSSAPESPERDR